MSEHSAVERTDEPITVSSLTHDLREIGLDAGDTVLVHTALSTLGWVCGGPQAVVDALQAVVTDTGTLVMPTFSGQYTDPADWSNPPVPDGWVDRIRETVPPFRPDVTPTRGMGAVPECFRRYPGVIRGGHPTVSFAAWGADAESIVTEHPLDDGLGERSPLGRIYRRDGNILLLGVGHDRNSSLHLAEYRVADSSERVMQSAPVVIDGQRVVVQYEDITINADDFTALGAAFERQVGSSSGTVGIGDARYVNQPAIVDFAVDWFEANRPSSH